MLIYAPVWADGQVRIVPIHRVRILIFVRVSSWVVHKWNKLSFLSAQEMAIALIMIYVNAAETGRVLRATFLAVFRSETLTEILAFSAVVVACVLHREDAPATQVIMEICVKYKVRRMKESRICFSTCFLCSTR